MMWTSLVNRVIEPSYRRLALTAVLNNNQRLFQGSFSILSTTWFPKSGEGWLLYGFNNINNKNNNISIQVRSKHSKRQIKRLFQGPRQIRLDKKLGIDRSPIKPPPPIEFQPVFSPPVILKNGWSQPPPADFQRPVYPFSIQRTTNKPLNAVGFLPIYSKTRHDGTKTITRIKKIRGDSNRFIQELRALLEIPYPKNPNDDIIRVRAGGTIEVDGNHVATIKKWLAGLGF